MSGFGAITDCCKYIEITSTPGTVAAFCMTVTAFGSALSNLPDPEVNAVLQPGRTFSWRVMRRKSDEHGDSCNHLCGDRIDGCCRAGLGWYLTLIAWRLLWKRLVRVYHLTVILYWLDRIEKVGWRTFLKSRARRHYQHSRRRKVNYTNQETKLKTLPGRGHSVK